MQTVLRAVYPPRCLTCGGLVESEHGLCGACWRDMPFIDGLVCDACGVPLPGESDRTEHCDACLVAPPPWAQGRAALAYRDRAKQIVLSFKHGDRTEIAKPAAAWMARAVAPILRPDTLILPIPLHLRRHLKRRYNQSALLAEGLAAQMSCDWAPDFLVRRVATPSLDGRSRADRFALLDGVIAVNPSHAARVAGRSVLLVDDVMTSGATLCGATIACFDAGAAEVRVCVLARVARDA